MERPPTGPPGEEGEKGLQRFIGKRQQLSIK
jgi:hypothetical protein